MHGESLKITLHSPTEIINFTLTISIGHSLIFNGRSNLTFEKWDLKKSLKSLNLKYYPLGKQILIIRNLLETREKTNNSDSLAMKNIKQLFCDF